MESLEETVRRIAADNKEARRDFAAMSRRLTVGVINNDQQEITGVVSNAISYLEGADPENRDQESDAGAMDGSDRGESSTASSETNREES